MKQAFSVRRAHMDDVKGIHSLLLQTAQKGLLLPRALIYLYSHIRNFWLYFYSYNTFWICFCS